jgi:hypothetical protein
MMLDRIELMKSDPSVLDARWSEDRPAIENPS